MRRVVLHPSAFVDWIGGGNSLRVEFEARQIQVVVPVSFVTDTMGLLAARGRPADRIVRAAGEIRRLGFQVTQPPDTELAMWLVRGMPPATAPYAALASWLDLPIAASDPELEIAFRTFPRA